MIFHTIFIFYLKSNYSLVIANSNICFLRYLIMKHIFLVFLILLSSSFLYATAPEITLNSIEPNPVQPGQDLTVQIKILNDGNDEIILGRTTLNFGESFILKSDDQNDGETTLCSSCSKSITFFLTAKSDLDSGFYTIKVKSQYDGTLSAEQDFSVQVTGLPNLVLNVVNELDVIPESSFELELELVNEGTGLAKNIKITPNSEEVGLLDENFLFQKTLGIGSSQKIVGNFLSSSEIEAGYLLLPITLSYEDSQNNLYEVEETIGLEIKDKANIILQHLEIENTITSGDPATISLRLENDGVGRAKNVRVSLNGDVSGQKEAFFGSLKKNEDLPFIFSVIPQNSGIIPLEITISYEDDFGSHTTIENVSLEVKSKSYLQIIIVGMLLLLGIIVLIIKRK